MNETTLAIGLLGVFGTLGLMVYIIQSVIFMTILKKLGSSVSWCGWIPIVRLFSLDAVANGGCTRAVLDFITSIIYIVVYVIVALAGDGNEALNIIGTAVAGLYLMTHYIILTQIQYKASRLLGFDSIVIIANIVFRGLMWIILACAGRPIHRDEY